MMVKLSGTRIEIDEKYLPKKGEKIIDVSHWTEKRLMELQTKLRKLYKVCRPLTKDLSKSQEESDQLKHPCHSCKVKACFPYLTDMENYLISYGVSIYKRSFKWRSTLEEFDRVVHESVTSLMMDIWIKRKLIKASFGKMLQWKMVYFLDGKINLFDNDKIQSIDQLHDSFPNSGDTNGEDIIEFYSATLKDAIYYQDGFEEVHSKEAVKSLLDLLYASTDILHKYLDNKMKYALYIRMLAGFKRSLEGNDTYIIFKDNSKARYYYQKLIDIMQRYLRELGRS